ncbi:hypothetical protein [Saccharopolyspora tripterygii]
MAIRRGSSPCGSARIRNGIYAIGDLFDASGRYGRYNVTTIAIFATSVVTQIPFMNLSIYQGPVAEWLGVDVSCFVRLLLPVLLYSFSSRRTTPQITSAR